MNVLKYTSYFHDGSLIDIHHDHSTIILSLESSEISPEENMDNICLSERCTIKGKLHLLEVGLIIDNKKQVQHHLSMMHDSANILHLKIYENTLSIDLAWVNFPPHSMISEYSFRVIQAKKMFWENIPDLYDPYG